MSDKECCTGRFATTWRWAKSDPSSQVNPPLHERQGIVRICMSSLICGMIGILGAEEALADPVQLGPRPAFLIDQMKDSALKSRLQSCATGPFSPTDFSIGHRGAPLQFPEHTAQSYKAGAQMGAGILECDVTFTKDLELVCRHSQNDLHMTTNILNTPLAAQCTAGFTPARNGGDASAECRTSDLTLAEFQTLRGKMDSADETATNLSDYMKGTVRWRTDLYASAGTLMTHAQSIALLRELDVKFMPELKVPMVDMPFNGFTRQDYAQKLIDEYKAAGVPPNRVWPQSFDLNDVLYWIEAEPAFGRQAVYSMDEYTIDGYSAMDPATWPHQMTELKAMGVNYIAPPLWMLLHNDEGQIVPSTLAIRARAAGLEIFAWTVERSGHLSKGGAWYYQSVDDLIDGDGALYEVIDVLAQDVGVAGIMSDWPATVTYYANCMGLK